MQFLNLLPPYQKSRITKEKTFLLVHYALGVVLIVALVSSAVLTAARASLVKYFDDVNASTKLVTNDNHSLGHQVNAANEKIARAGKVQKDFIKWTALLNSLVNNIPANTTITFADLNTETGTMRLNGETSSRETLLLVKDFLENSGLLVKLDAPLSNLLEKDDVSFRFAGELKADLFKEPPPPSQYD